MRTLLFSVFSALLLSPGAAKGAKRAPPNRLNEALQRLASQAPPAPEQDEASAARADLERQAKVLAPLVDRLETIRMGHPLLADLRPIAAERTELRRRVTELAAVFTEGCDRFTMLRKRSQAREITRLISGGASDEAGAGISRAVELEQASKELKDLRKRAKTVLWYEEVDYQTAARALRAKKEAGELKAGAAAAVLVLGLGAWAWRRRHGGPPLLSGTPTGRGGPAGPGDVVGGNFRLEREIGRGGMGLVFEALDLSLQRKVAVKQMRAETRENPKDLALFLAEARLVASLKHPNIVEIHSIVNDGGELYLVFEFVAGGPLHALLQRAPRLPLPSVRRLLGQVGPALDYAHAQKVIHRDLKPANIMVTPQGAVKVMDFGLAHQARQTAARQTKAESWGTLPYMAPEQELGSVSRESDLYSLGVCLYEAMTGKLPFTGPNYLAQKREMRFAPPSRAAPGVPAAFDPVLRRALDADPARRYHSAAELTAAFDGLGWAGG